MRKGVIVSLLLLMSVCTFMVLGEDNVKVLSQKNLIAGKVEQLSEKKISSLNAVIKDLTRGLFFSRRQKKSLEGLLSQDMWQEARVNYAIKWQKTVSDDAYNQFNKKISRLAGRKACIFIRRNGLPCSAKGRIAKVVIQRARRITRPKIDNMVRDKAVDMINNDDKAAIVAMGALFPTILNEKQTAKFEEAMIKKGYMPEYDQPELKKAAANMGARYVHR